LDWIVTLSQQIWNGLINGVAYVIFAVGLTLIFGVLKVTNIAHGEFFMLGAMLLYTIQTIFGLNFFEAIIPVVLIVAIFGFIINRLAIRPLLTAHPLSTLLSTLAISYIILNASVIFWPYPKAVKPPITGEVVICGVHATNASLVSLLIGAIVIGALYFFLTKVKLGKEIDATSQNLVGASLVGINVNKIYDVTLMMAAGMAAVGGILVAPIWQANTTIGQYILLKGFAIVVVAGMGNVMGCVWIGLIAGVAEAIFGQYVSMYYREGFLFVIMIISLLLRPEGWFKK
jgi:branched-chain amino acid transport system permease protein